jgi:prepilin-type processing-associated H-X9-DG protein
VPELSPEQAMAFEATRANRTFAPSFPGHVIPMQQTSNLAIASLVLGIAGFVLCSIFTTIPGAIVGHLALNEIKREPAKAGSRGFAIAGLIICYVNLAMTVIGIGFAILFFVFAATASTVFGPASQSFQTQMCSSNLEALSSAFAQYASANGGAYPLLSNVPGELTLSDHEDQDFYPDYLRDEFAFHCTAKGFSSAFDETENEKPYSDESYVYLGYIVTSELELAAFSRAYEGNLLEAGAFSGPLDVDPGKGSAGGDAFLPLGMTSFKPIQGKTKKREIPVLIEWPANHKDEGGHVLYLDGHVEWVNFPGKWPMTETSIELLTALDDMGE